MGQPGDGPLRHPPQKKPVRPQFGQGLFIQRGTRVIWPDWHPRFHDAICIPDSTTPSASGVLPSGARGAPEPLALQLGRGCVAARHHTHLQIQRAHDRAGVHLRAATRARASIWALLRLYCGSTPALLQLYCGCTAALLRLPCGSTAALPRLYRGSLAAPLRLHRGSTAAPPRLHRGSTAALLQP